MFNHLKKILQSLLIKQKEDVTQNSKGSAREANASESINTKSEPIVNEKKINYHSLETPEEKRQAIDVLLSCFSEREHDSQESLETVIEKIIQDEDIRTAAAIAGQLKNICLTVWKDDLHPGYSYQHILSKLAKQSKGAIPISEIIDEYQNLSYESDSVADTKISLTSNGSSHQVTLKNGTYLNYNFIRVILEAAKANNVLGKYYLVDDECIEDGFHFAYLDEKEYAAVKETGILDLYELTEKQVYSISNIWD